MRLAVLSDIHANREALYAVIDTGRAHGVDAWLCLGDIVGYGADPQACLHRVRELTDAVILGNHDAAAVGLQDLAYFNPHARRAAEWTAEQLNDAERQYLAALPLVLEQGEALFVHAEPSRPTEWGYVVDLADAQRALMAIAQRFCFVGHSHYPLLCAECDGEVKMVAAGPIQTQSRYLANVGSVGQPRDGDPRACFALWDQAADTLELVRCPYDIATAQNKIIAAGLPPFLAERLAQGQ
ncbi:MAG: metallophosphoesterase family protein [Candidatus Latescibacterota bacterium]|nr:metallophosphoesterase family protein [Candidatus Latescibacterota bacterium]